MSKNPRYEPTGTIECNEPIYKIVDFVDKKGKPNQDLVVIGNMVRKNIEDRKTRAQKRQRNPKVCARKKIVRSKIFVGMEWVNKGEYFRSPIIEFIDGKEKFVNEKAYKARQKLRATTKKRKLKKVLNNGTN